MTFETITYHVEAGIARLTLNRPDRLNSFTDAMHEEIRQAMDALEADASARVLVLSGAGRGFCAGQDLNDRSVSSGDGPPDLGASVEKNYKPLVMRLQNLRMPTVCAVNGVAAGAGASLALACDIVIAAKSASFLQAFSKIGLIPDTGGTWFLPQRVGMARAMGLALLAEKLPAEKAAEWGLIWACVEDAELTATVDKIATQFASAPTRALVRTRQAMRASMNNDLETQLDLEGNMMRELGQTHDYREGVAAFMAKRAPVFKGE
jgi:2-(1,2-epoxy-1,2-dihydrophenyl)acetyl-CoA isomerase